MICVVANYTIAYFFTDWIISFSYVVFHCIYVPHTHLSVIWDLTSFQVLAMYWVLQIIYVYIHSFRSESNNKPTASVIESNMNKSDYNKLKELFVAKVGWTKTKRQINEWEKIFSFIHIT